MNASEVYIKQKDDYKVVKWYCRKCGTIYQTKERAENCCTPQYCSKCGKKIEGLTYSLNEPRLCWQCIREENENKKPIIEESQYNGEALFDESGEFYESLDDYIDQTDGYEKIEDIPNFIHLAKEKQIRYLDIADVLSNYVENMNLDDDYDQIYSNTKELEEYIDKWNEKQKGTVYYEESEIRLRLSDETKRKILGS